MKERPLTTNTKDAAYNDNINNDGDTTNNNNSSSSSSTRAGDTSPPSALSPAYAEVNDKDPNKQDTEEEVRHVGDGDSTSGSSGFTPTAGYCSFSVEDKDDTNKPSASAASVPVPVDPAAVYWAKVVCYVTIAVCGVFGVTAMGLGLTLERKRKRQKREEVG